LHAKEPPDYHDRKGIRESEIETAMIAESDELFLGQRKRDTSVVFTSEKTLKVKSVFSDPYHEIELTGVFTHPNLEILDLEPVIVRHPHGACRESIHTMKSMIGEKVRPGLMKEMFRRAGKQGCFHLNAVFRDMIEGAIFGRGRRVRHLLSELFPDISYAQTYKVALTFRPELMDSCNAYDADGELVREILQTSLPEGMASETIQELEEYYEALNSSGRRAQAATGRF